MIFLVDHHADTLVLTEHEAAAGVFRGVFAADEMSLDENLLSSVVSLSMPVSKLSFIDPTCGTLSRMCLKVSTRTDFFAQPGNGALARFRARRTRLTRRFCLTGLRARRPRQGWKVSRECSLRHGVLAAAAYSVFRFAILSRNSRPFRSPPWRWPYRAVSATRASGRRNLCLLPDRRCFAGVARALIIVLRSPSTPSSKCS